MKHSDTLLLIGVLGVAVWYFFFGPGTSQLGSTVITTGGATGGQIVNNPSITNPPPRITTGTVPGTSYTGTGGEQASAGSAGSFGFLGGWA